MLLLITIHTTVLGIISTISLWGHSMGAATALAFSHTDPSIAALVLDCAFAGLCAERAVVTVAGSYNCTELLGKTFILMLILSPISRCVDFKVLAMEMTKHAEEAGFKVFC